MFSQQRDFLLLFFYYFRKNIPNSKLFYSFYSLLKYIGVILITHNVKGLEDNVFSFYKIILSLTLFGNNYKLYISSYFYIIITVFIIILLFLLFTFVNLLFIQRKFKEDPSCSSLSQCQIRNIQIIAIGWTILSLFSQHLIEIFTLGIIHFSNSQYELLKEENITNEYIIFGISIVGIILSELFPFLFYYFSKSFSITSFVGNRNLAINTFTHILMAICSSTQGIFSILNHTEHATKYHYFINIILAFLLLIQLIFNIKEYNYFENNYALVVEKFLLYWSLISSIDEIIIYYTCNNPFSQSYSILKIVLEIGNSLILTQFNIIFVNKFYLNRFMMKIFNEKSHFDYLELLSYERLVYKYKKKQLPFNALFQLFTYHKELCNMKNCACKLLSISKWITQIHEKTKEYSVEIKESQIEEQSFEDFVIIGEHEITRTLFYLHKSREKSRLQEKLINLHIGYILNIKNDPRHALYFSSQYIALHSAKISFIYLLYLFEYKYEAYLKMTSEKVKGVKKKLGEQTLNKIYRLAELYHKPAKLYEFTLEIQKMKKLLIKCSDLLCNIIEFRKNIDSKGMAQNSTTINSENFILKCKDFRKNHLELCNSLTRNKTKLKHYETCYMLTIYFESSMHCIPENVKETFKVIHSFDYFLEKKGRINSYKCFNVMNPLILFINKKDEFIIKYISNSLCNELNYNHQDIINTNFDRLIPVETVLIHKLLMKKFFLTSNSSFKTNKFILDNKRNIVPLYLICKPLPTIDCNFGINVSIKFTNVPKLNEKDYYLLLDRDWKILLMSKEFSEEFFFTLQMLNMLKMNFSTFFGVNMDRMKLKAKEIFTSEKMTNVTLEEENQVLIPFSSGKHETMFKDRKMNDISEAIKRVKKCVINGKISKNSIIKNLENINQIIDEMGFDIEWYTRVNCLKDRMSLSTKNLHIKAKYQMIKIEKLVYTVVNLTESINPNQNENIEMIKESIHKLDCYSVPKYDMKESVKFSGKYEVPLSKYKTGKSLVVAGSDNNDLPSPMNKNLSKGNQNVSPTSSFKKDPQTSASALPSQNSILGLNKTNVALLNLSSSMQKRSIFEKSQLSLTEMNFETRELFKNQKLKFYLEWTYKVLCIFLVCLGLSSFIFNSSIMTLSQSLFEMNIYALFLKSDIYFSSLNILSSCELAQFNNQDGLVEHHERLKNRSIELINHFGLFSQSLNSLVDNNQVKDIFSLINLNEEYKGMLQNYEIGTRYSSIYDEIFYIHYYLYKLSDSSSFKSCRLEVLFINKGFENLINTKPGPSYEETVVYYIYGNVLFSLRRVMEKLVKTTNEILKNYYMQCQLLITIYNCATLILSLLVCVSFSIIVINDKNNIQIILNMIYTKKPSEEKFDDQLKAFRVILESFSTENCMRYESIVKNKRNSMLTGSNNKIKEKRKTHKSLRQSKLESNDGKERVKSFSKEMTTPKIVRLSFLIIICLISILIVIVIFDILYSRSLYQDLMFSNIISINFIDRIPKFGELLLYSKISICFNDEYYITTEPEAYDQLSYSNYYKITIDKDSDSVFGILKNSEYAYLHYQFLQIKENINMFIHNDKGNEKLKETVAWDYNLNSKEGLCIYSALGFHYYSNFNITIKPLFQSASNIVKRCRKNWNGIALNSINDFLEFANKEMTNLYVDFVKFDRETRDPIVFLTNFLFISFAEITDETMNYAHNSFIYFILKDLNNMYMSSNMISFGFSLTFVVACITAFIYIHFHLISKIEEKINILTFILKMLSTRKVPQ